MTLPVSGVGTPAIAEWAIPRANGAEWAVGSAAGAGGAGGAGGAPAADPSDGFGSMLGDAIGQLERSQAQAAEQARALATGETQDITSVVSAVQEASLSMQLASQVRNKATEAYAEIFRTQV